MEGAIRGVIHTTLNSVGNFDQKLTGSLAKAFDSTVGAFKNTWSELGNVFHASLGSISGTILSRHIFYSLLRSWYILTDIFSQESIANL